MDVACSEKRVSTVRHEADDARRQLTPLPNDTCIFSLCVCVLELHLRIVERNMLLQKCHKGIHCDKELEKEKGCLWGFYN